MARALFLAPGVGAQGATPQDVAEVFAACPDRVMPSASRALLVAGTEVSRLRDTVASLAGAFRDTLGSQQAPAPLRRTGMRGRGPLASRVGVSP